MSGFIESLVDLPGGQVARDRNGFVTALAARALRGSARPVPAAMLDALACCARDDGGYGFWPLGAAPGWARELPADGDDTAVIALELWRAGRIDRLAARRAAGRVARHRVTIVPDPGPRWIRRGTFALWHRPGARASMVDCTATANMLALLAATGLLHLPGSADALATLSAALDWAGDDPARAASLSPFYPDPAELAAALSHAAASGVHELASLAAAVARARWGRPALDRGAAAVCSSPYGGVRWRSPALAAIRDGGGTA